MASSGLIMAVWLTQSLKMVDFWMNRGVPFETFLKLVLFVLPDLIVIVLPIALLIGLTFVFSKLTNDKEIIALKAAGVSDQDFARPALLMASLVFMLLYAINLYILPQAFREFRQLEKQLLSTIRASMLVPGEFNTFKDITLFVRQRTRDGQLKGILIYDGRKSEKPFTLMAEAGQVLESPQGAIVILSKGTRQEISPTTSQPSLVNFEQYTLSMSTHGDKDQPRILKPYEMSLKELLLLGEKETGYQPLKLQAEAHQRLLMPFLSFIFSIIVVLFFLRGDYNRRGRSGRVGKIMGISLLLEITVLIFLHLGSKHIIGILGAYATVFSSLILGISHLWSSRLNGNISSHPLLTQGRLKS